jgi:uncharacterized protein YyaL (SSP411 family)
MGQAGGTGGKQAAIYMDSKEKTRVDGLDEGGRMNGLARAASAYLRSAMHQPVEWMEWGQAAFDRAAAEDKPILLDIGAVWCHWCHVMDRESYEDAATARVINEHFVAVKVDRDERPDVDTRYQAAVSAISGQGGWPLTAFLTPEGKPYFGGTYFPPEDRHGRPSFRRVLLTMADAFANRRAEVDESAGSVMEAIEQNEAFSGRGSGEPGADLVETMAVAVLKTFDPRHGGFGSQPKFPHSSSLDLLIDVASRKSGRTIALGGASMALPDAARRAAIVTLDKMSQGGIYDQLAGGFHRYSVDEHWTVPHFEKMSYDNSELLKNYVHAYQAFGEEEFAWVARDIVRWMDEWLTDRELGGFYASQDADYSLDDDGDYFTWTMDEARDILRADELAMVCAFYDIGEIGDMHHNVSKNVLHVTLELDAAARKAGVPVTEAVELLTSARRKMYAARLERATPFIDKTIYVSWNAMCISAYIAAGRVLEMPDVLAFALKSLDRVMDAAWDASAGLAHVVAYGAAARAAGEADSSAALQDGKQRLVGGLDDYVFLGHALLDAWEATGKLKYYDAAKAIAATTLERFYDAAGAGFFDTEVLAEGEERLGALSARRKPLQDSPTPAGNPMAAALLLRLDALDCRLEYAAKARETLDAFAGVVEHFGLYASTYALTVQRMAQNPIRVCVVGEDKLAQALEKAALERYGVNYSVVRLKRLQLGLLPPILLPPELQRTLPRMPKPEGSFAVVCSGNACHPAVQTVEELTALLTHS